MNSIDEKIRKALTEEDQKAIEQIDDEAGLFELVGLTFKGKQAWMTYYMWGGLLAVFIAGLFFLDWYISTTDLKESLNWALALIACMFAIAIIKVIIGQQIIKMELMREIKRLEMRTMLAIDRNANDKQSS